MSSRIGILIVAFLPYAMVASGYFLDLPGFSGLHPDHNPPANDRGFQVSEQQKSHEGDDFMHNSPANDHLFEASEQQRSHEGDNSLVPLEPGFKKEGPTEPDQEPVQESDSKPIEEPEPKPAEEPEPKPKPKTGTKPVQKPGKDGLREMFYEQSCPDAEKIVNETIHKHFQKDPTYAAAFIRLFFHDCFVTGCDASILLDTTPTHEEVEKKARHNGPLVRGYEVVDDIKAQVEAACPGVVSCADTLAFATRDSLVYTGVPAYAVEGGRRDARASLAVNVENNLPLPDATAEDNRILFEKKGMTLEDLVVLLGAHSVGSAHCSIVAKRFRDKEKQKDIDRGYWLKMQTMTICASETQDVPFDPYSQHKMDSRFYKELLTNKALVESDHNLAKDPRANNLMKKLVDDQAGWLAKFTNAMKKLGATEVLVGDKGEIRKQCRSVN